MDIESEGGRSNSEPGRIRSRQLWLLIVFCLLVLGVSLFVLLREDGLPSTAEGPGQGPAVILLHGLARSNRSMSKIEGVLIERGYRVLNLDYESSEGSIDELVEAVLVPAVEAIERDSPSRLHFVTHSMGGLLIRVLLRDRDIPNLGRVVMISPPNRGSELVDLFGRIALFDYLHGPAGRQLGTDEDSLPLRLPPVDFELGVIAGDRSFNPLYSWIIPGEDDGVVSVEHTKVEGMRDFIVLHRSHSFILRTEDTIRQVLHFLETGRFDHGQGKGEGPS